MSQGDRSDILDSAPREKDQAFLFPLFLGAISTSSRSLRIDVLIVRRGNEPSDSQKAHLTRTRNMLKLQRFLSQTR